MQDLVERKLLPILVFWFLLDISIIIADRSELEKSEILACNAGISGSISRLGRSPGEGIGYPLEFSWTSLVAQLVKNPPAMQETWV